MTRTILRRGAMVGAGLAMLLALALAAAVVTGRPRTEPLVVDLDTAEVVAFLAAERQLMASYGLDYTEHVVTVDDPGLRVRVLEVGEGPPVLMVPPAAGEAARFAPVAAELDGHRLLLVNLPGGGASDGVDLRAVDHRQLARNTLDAVYEHFRLDAVPIVASSVGGSSALWHKLDRPERVTAGVQLGVPMAVAGTDIPTELGVLAVPGVNRLVAATLPAASPGQAADGFEEVFGHPVGTADALPEAVRTFEHALQQLPTYRLAWRSLAQDSFCLAGLGGWDPAVEIGRDELAGLLHPTLLVWPSHDPFGDPDTGREIASHLPGAELEFAGVGHLPWLDDPSRVGALTQRFLAQHGYVRPA